jgi:hypothetical protein
MKYNFRIPGRYKEPLRTPLPFSLPYTYTHNYTSNINFEKKISKR